MKKLTLKETQIALKDILFEFDRICRKHGLRYSLYAGTLLGAVRHKGFIPWDDDVDVCMPRPDYEKLIEILSREGELGEHYLLSYDRGKKGVYPFVKLMDDRYPVKCSNHIEVPYLYIDIFPLDGLPDGKEEIEKEYRKDLRTAFFLLLCKWYTVDRKWGFLLWIVGFWLYLFALCTGQSRYIRRLNRRAEQYPWENSKIVGVRSWGKARYVMPRSVYENCVEIEFEGGNLMAIADWDKNLSLTYGNYMRLPPENKRKTQHCMKVYRK